MQAGVCLDARNCIAVPDKLIILRLLIRAAGSCVNSLSAAGTTPAGALRHRRDTSGIAPCRRRHWRRQARSSAGARKKVPAGKWAAGRHSQATPEGAEAADAEGGQVGPAWPGRGQRQQTRTRTPGQQARDGQEGMTAADADVPQRRKTIMRMHDNIRQKNWNQ